MEITIISSPDLSLLNDSDMHQYLVLQDNLLQTSQRSHRNKKTEDLEQQLVAIKKFCIRGDDDDYKRCFVCGICWLNVGLAINIRQLKYLIHKCKSSINTTMRKIGYELSKSRGDVSDELIDFLPSIKGNIPELRKWSIRRPPAQGKNMCESTRDGGEQCSAIPGNESYIQHSDCQMSNCSFGSCDDYVDDPSDCPSPQNDYEEFFQWKSTDTSQDDCLNFESMI